MKWFDDVYHVSNVGLTARVGRSGKQTMLRQCGLNFVAHNTYWRGVNTHMYIYWHHVYYICLYIDTMYIIYIFTLYICWEKDFKFFFSSQLFCWHQTGVRNCSSDYLLLPGGRVRGDPRGAQDRFCGTRLGEGSPLVCECRCILCIYSRLIFTLLTW